MNSTKIPVKNKDLGFWTQEPITVYRKEDDTIVWCNHDGYTTETEENTIYRIDSPDLTFNTVVDTCNKCSAWRTLDEPWQDAPSEGNR